jgi:hypothetical protein
MTVFIPYTAINDLEKKSLFILTRPFFKGGEWIDSAEEKSKWGLDSHIVLADTIEKAQLVLLPITINQYYASKNHLILSELNAVCQKLKIQAFGLISGDFGIAYPEFSNITYFRMGGFRSQLPQGNKGFPVALSDHFQRIFKQDTITPFVKNDVPVIGFCGHATTSASKRFKEWAKCIRENTARCLQSPFRNDWEPLFASAYERAKLLLAFEDSPLVKTNFIYRDHYRGGAQTDVQREMTTLEYYNNIAASDYVLCIRGAGNFSVRFYETLMMGKIPVFVNTDCLLPFDDQISWREHVVWIEWKDRKNIASIVSAFHQRLSPDDFIQLQFSNRKLWKETLSVKGMLSLLMQ